MKSLLLIAITLCLFGCGKEQVGPAANGTVHLAGYITTSTGSPVASYWRDSIYTDLTKNNTYSEVSSLYVDGSSVLMGGWKVVVNSLPPAVIWQDGTETVIPGAFGSPTLIASRNHQLFGVWFEGPTGWVINRNGTSQPMVDTAYTFGPSAIALLGEDLYTAGASIGPDTYQHAQCWKNEKLIFRESLTSYATSIFVHQNDIYMAGFLYDYEFFPDIACYWKNGQRVNLTDGSVRSVAKSMFVSNTHVYVSGMIGDQAVYWKDGVAIYLTKEGLYSMANSIFVQGSDVHVAGFEHGHPAYWKNDVRQSISNQDKFGQVSFVVVGSN